VVSLPNVGHTTHTVKEAVADAAGGCLFLDEARTLSDHGDDGFSGGPIRMLLRRGGNDHNNLLVFLPVATGGGSFTARLPKYSTK
jgi:hypothetical protein